MSGDYSDGEDSGGHKAYFVDATANTEVDLHLPLEVDMQPDKPREDAPAYSGADDLGDISQDKQRRLKPPNGPNRNGPDTGCRCLSIWNHVDNCRGATAQVTGSGTGHCKQGAVIPTYPGLAQRRQRAGTKTPTHFNFGKSTGLQSPDGQLPPLGEQFELDPFGPDLPKVIDLDIRTRLMCRARSGLPALCLLTLWHAYSWSWEQYRQVFDAIVL